MLKTGIIQPESVPGAFTANLRNIVTLYRDCVDKGAQIVLCPAMALSGIHTGDLNLRIGFKEQLKAALNYLAKEIMHVPLLLCERAQGPDNEDSLQAYLLCKGNLTPLRLLHYWLDYDFPAFLLIKTTTPPGFEIKPFPSENAEHVLVAVPTLAFHQCSLQQDKMLAKRYLSKWELDAPVIILRSAGAQGEHIFTGGSCVIYRDGTMHRLKLFKQDCAVCQADDPTPAEKLPDKKTLLCGALLKGTADFITRNGYNHAVINLTETPYATTLIKLLKTALPDLPITAIIPLYTNQDAKVTAAKRFARTHGITTVELPAPTTPHAEVHLAWLIRQWAEENNAIFLSALCATEAFTDTPALQAAGVADFIPLAELFIHDLKLLFPKEICLTAEQKESSLRLEALCRKESSAGVLLRDIPMHEAEIRRYQRLIEKTAPLRQKLPPRLRLNPQEWPHIPIIHGLRD